MIMKKTVKHIAATAALALMVATGCAHMELEKPGAEDAAEETARDDQGLTPEERLELGSIYESRGEDDLALEQYEKVSEEDRYNADAYFALANLHMKREELDEAEKNYARALEINPTGPYYNNLGWLYMEKGRFDRAEEEVRKAMKADPAKRYIYLDTLGVIQMRRSRYGEAEKSLTEAAALTPADQAGGLEEIYTHLEELYERTGERSKAEAVRDKLERLGEAEGE